MALQLEFLGGVGTVTGSKTLLRFEHANYLLDCGLFQGHRDLRKMNWSDPSFDFKSLERIILTHAHLDHSGYVPRLWKLGCRTKVLCSKGTAALCEILWKDAAHLQEEDAEFANRTGYSSHKPAAPLFDASDAEGAISLLEGRARDEWIQIGKNVGVRFLRSGHIVGSSFVQFSVHDGATSRLITFSGDVGNGRLRTLKGPVDLIETDYLVLESTYGDRDQSRTDPKVELGEILTKTIKRGGVTIIPAFSIGRSQEIIYLIRLLEDEGVIPAVPVVLDSPMSNAATDVYLSFSEDNAITNGHSGEESQFFPKLFERIESADESMMACTRDGPLIVISAAGMLTGGRVLHHLKKRLPDEKNTVLFVGYQAEGSKGRFLQEKGKSEGKIRIHHEEVDVNAEISTIGSLSAHVDSADILAWLGRMRKLPKQIFINHGSPEASRALAKKITDQFGILTTAVLDQPKWNLDL